MLDAQPTWKREVEGRGRRPLVDRDGIVERRRGAYGRAELAFVEIHRLLVRRGVLGLPGRREANRGVGIDLAVAIILADMQPAAVPVARAVKAPGRVGGIHLDRRIGQDLLDIAIAQ